MQKRAGFVAVLTLASATAASAAPVRRAGEWRTTIDNGRPLIACFPTDATLDRNSITRPLAKLPGVSCTVTGFDSVGDVTTYAMQCKFNGNLMTTSGTITATGSDAFTTKAHSHGGAIPMPNGKTVALPDSDMVTVSRRLGPCKPSDRIITF